jgi:small-conductance mechanosensitive channel
MLARRFLLLDLTPGDWIESALVRGQLVEIGRTTTQLRENGEPIFVPNRLLAQAVIRKIQPPDTAASAGPA